MSAKHFMPKAALWAGLDHAAPDTESWLAGAVAYDESQDRGETLDQSYNAALDAAAPDSMSWMFGKDAIYRTLFSKNNVEAAKAVANRLFASRPRPSKRSRAQHS